MTDVTQGQDGFFGQKGYNSSNSQFNSIMFMIQQALGLTNTIKLVKIKKVADVGAVAPVGFVDVQPLVNMMNGIGDASEHGTIFNIPYFRIQGGRNAVIIDPEVDDIGIMVCADRDISSVKESKKVGNPGSFRRFSMADGLYIGGVLNGEPEQYVRFSEDGIEIADKHENTIEMGEDGITINGVTFNRDGQVDGDLPVTGDVTAKAGTGQFVRLSTHTHPANNSPPTPGT